VGGFPDLSEVAFELSETQQLQNFEVLGFVPNVTKISWGS
jgi:hypothetical protein